jgi:hypothetical protein
MFHPKTFRTFARVMKILLMVLLIGFELVPSLSGGDAQYINQTALQLTRSQVLVNSAYALIYRPAAEQAQALHDMQHVLPAFEHEQALLLTNPTADVQALLHLINVDYLSLVGAAHAIIAHPEAATTPIQVNIIVEHEYNYVVSMNSLLPILVSHFNERNIQLFIIQIIIEILFIVLFVIAIATFAWELYIHGLEKAPSVPLRTIFSLFGKRAIIILMVFMLIGLEIVALCSGKDAVYLYQATSQRVRCEVLAKSAFVLAYRAPADKALAFSNVQIILPLFQQEQTVLLANSNADVQRQVQQAKPEYQTMLAAGHTLIASPKQTVDSTANTIITHRKSCVAAMNGIVHTLQNNMEQRAAQIFAAEVSIEVIFIIFFALLLVFSRDPFRSSKMILK